MIKLEQIFEGKDPEVAIKKLTTEELQKLLKDTKVAIDIHFVDNEWAFIFALNRNPHFVRLDKETEGWRDLYSLNMPIHQWMYLLTLGHTPQLEAFRTFLLVTLEEESTWYYEDNMLYPLDIDEKDDDTNDDTNEEIFTEGAY
jgi:hypothetical protein